MIREKLKSERGEVEWALFIMIFCLFVAFTAFIGVSSYIGRSKKALKEATMEARRKAQEEDQPIFRGPDGYQVFCKRSKFISFVTNRDCIY